jgi:anti-sigma-K factor RskA
MTDVHTLAGAYALDAVNDLERAAFHRHLVECETCGLEVAELRETVARLSDATWTEPPPALRGTVLAEIARTPQVRPGRLRPTRTVPVSWRRWTATAVAAGILAAAAGTAGYVVQEQRLREAREQVAAAQEHAARIETVLAAPDAQVTRDQVPGSGTVTVVGSRMLGEAVVMLDDLPALSEDEAYQLWLGEDGTLIPAGVMPPGQGSASALLTELGDADRIGVSREPAGGSPTGQPTGQIVAAVDVS